MNAPLAGFDTDRDTFLGQFGISRIQFREMASAGLIPGVKKASW